MPSAIAIRMYCVNLLDICDPPRFRRTDCRRFWPPRNKLRWHASASPRRHCEERLRRSNPVLALWPLDCFARARNHEHRGGKAMSDVNRQILLVEKPAGKLGPEHFSMAKGSIPEPKDGEALLRVRYISLDAANRAWMHGATYRAAVEANTVMAGGGIGEVGSAKAAGLAPGDIVFGATGWQDYAAVPAKHLTKMPKVEPTTDLLRVYGIA